MQKDVVIYKQAAIDAIKEYIVDPNHAISEYEDNVFNYNAGLKSAVQAIVDLPSAQPELSMEIEEILNYLDTTLHPIVSPDNWYVYSELHDMVSMLPSARPEIVRCRDCKNHDGIRCFRWNSTIITGFDDFCSKAERRTDDIV